MRDALALPRAEAAHHLPALGHAGQTETAQPARSVADRLLSEPFAFGFFQAVRLLERLFPERAAVGRSARPSKEVVRFHAHLSLSFPPSELYELAQGGEGPFDMTVAFMGLTGPSGVLPRHYTELLLRLDWQEKGAEKGALRAWFDLFNHRLISFFFRAWEKYRFYIPYERREFAAREPDPFTRCLLSLIGMEARPGRSPFHPQDVSPLRNRLRVSLWDTAAETPQERVLAGIDDLALLRYSGFLSRRRRTAAALQAVLHDYFALHITIQQLRGQWLYLEPGNQSRMGGAGSNNELGVNLVAGERVWDLQSKFRIRIGPLSYAEFAEFLPDRAPVPERKRFFLLCQLVRLMVGMEFDFEVQLVLKKDEVPACQLVRDAPVGPRLGWTTWLCTAPPAADLEDVAFNGEHLVWLNGEPTAAVLS